VQEHKLPNQTSSTKRCEAARNLIYTDNTPITYTRWSAMLHQCLYYQEQTLGLMATMMATMVFQMVRGAEEAHRLEE
jgi:hypothetical protein